MRGMLHAVIVRSPHAHARIRSIDTSAAEASPGVHGVFTAQHVGEAGLPGMVPVGWLLPELKSLIKHGEIAFYPNTTPARSNASGGASQGHRACFADSDRSSGTQRSMYSESGSNFSACNTGLNTRK